MKIGIFFCIIFSFYGISCASKTKTKNDPTDTLKYEGALITFEEVKTLYSENAQMKIKLEAPLQYSDQNGDVRYPKGAMVTMYNENGIRSTTLRADSAFYEKIPRLYTAIGKVVVRNLIQKQTLQTDKLHWNQAKREIYTDQPVRITTPYEILEGIGMTCDEDFTEYTIWKPTGIFTVD